MLGVGGGCWEWEDVDAPIFSRWLYKGGDCRNLMSLEEARRVDRMCQAAETVLTS